MSERIGSLRPRRRPPYQFEPETMTWAEAAAVACRATESWLRDHIASLDGFPTPDGTLDVFSAKAVRGWVDRRFGLVTPATSEQDAEATLIGRARAKHGSPIPRRPAA